MAPDRLSVAISIEFIIPKSLEKLQYVLFDKNATPHLKCSSCTAVIGTPMIYDKENRPAYYMKPGAFILEKQKCKHFGATIDDIKKNSSC
jgi:hypothetical protein